MDLEYIKHDYRALGMRVKGMGALLDFDFLFDHGNDQEGFEGKWGMLRVSKSLHSCCYQFGFLLHGNLFEDQGLLERQCPPLEEGKKHFC